ncbi:FxLYD domain-containing protein [Achromobacter xylosoxidans]
MLYPGERIPVLLNGENFERYSEVKTHWKPAKRAALPGSRPALDISVENTEAGIGTGTLNFTYRYRYKYVTVHGRVRNNDDAEIDNVKVWVSLYDAQDKLTGARYSSCACPSSSRARARRSSWTSSSMAPTSPAWAWCTTPRPTEPRAARPARN